MTIILPNIRKIFVPDKGYVVFDADLRGADAYVVAWEADDSELKQWLRDDVDMHVRHCVEVGNEPQILTLTGNAHHKLRQSYKHATHGVHYVASARAIASHPAIGWSLGKATQFRDKYLRRRPGLRNWHLRTEHDLQRSRSVANRFGYRIVYFDRIETVLPQAVAWVPQSTVALTCFKGALRLRRELPWVQILLQVHDSLVFQVPFYRAEQYDLILRTLSITVPYPDPLTIPWGLARSEKSWGDCEKIDLKKAA